MKATVVAIKEPFVAIRTTRGLTVVELLDGAVERGEVVIGDFDALGGATMRNETRGVSLEVFVQDFDCSPEVAWRTYGLR